MQRLDSYELAGVMPTATAPDQPGRILDDPTIAAAVDTSRRAVAARRKARSTRRTVTTGKRWNIGDGYIVRTATGWRCHGERACRVFDAARRLARADGKSVVAYIERAAKLDHTADHLLRR